jgi:hypothetical protein
VSANWAFVSIHSTVVIAGEECDKKNKAIYKAEYYFLRSNYSVPDK